MVLAQKWESQRGSKRQKRREKVHERERDNNNSQGEKWQKILKKNGNMRAVSRSLTRSVRRQMRGGAGEDGMMEGSFSRFSSQDAADKSERTGSALHRYSVCLRVLPHPLCRGLRMCARHCLPLIPQHEYWWAFLHAVAAAADWCAHSVQRDEEINRK